MKTGWETYLRFMRASISVCAVVVVTGVVFFEKFSFVVVEVECSGLNFWLVGGGFFIELSRRHIFRGNKVSTRLFTPHCDNRRAKSDDYLRLLLL